MAKALLNCEIIVADIDPAKRQLALDEGADTVIEPADKNAVKALIKSTRGGVTGAIDFVGSDRSLSFGIQAWNKGDIVVVWY